MRPLRSISLTLAIAVASICWVGAQSAGAAVIPADFSPSQLHGEYAWGGIGDSRLNYNPTRFARVNLHTGATTKFTPSLNFNYFWFGPSTDRAATALATYGSYSSNTQMLVRQDIFTGTQILDSIPAPTGNCWPRLNPISIANDGTVIALKQIPNDTPPNVSCSLDPSKTRLLRYAPGKSEGEDVWLPEKYRAWLTNYNISIDANENSVALAKRSTSKGPGLVVALDTEKHKVLARQIAGKVSSVSLANPRSLYWSQDGSRLYGKVKYLRIGKPDPRTIFRGQFNDGSTTNCGNRALVLQGRTLRLLSPKSKTLLTRRVKLDHFIAGIACSGDYLHFLDVESTDDYYGNDPYVRHIANISKLP
jgi:hypothetical protein